MSEYHELLLRPFVQQAERNLAERRAGRCICKDPDCQRNQISLEAWHLRWAMFDASEHDPGDEDRSPDAVELRLRDAERYACAIGA